MAEALKHKYNEAYINRLAKALHQAHPSFKQALFKKHVLDKHWRHMELKQRLHHITHCIHQTLDLPYPKALTVLMKAAKAFGGYEGMFFPDYVEQYGLTQPTLANWPASMKALEFFTQISSAEFAVRPFITKDTKKMMAQMLKWSQHKNEHVRRLASEGCRPRLPWAMALPAFKKNPSMIFPILDNLKTDESLYVRKSVANNLNDISKDHPDLVIQWCRKNIGKHKHTDWIIKRACRTLLKAGNADALNIFSYQRPQKTKLTQLQLSKTTLHIGETLQFSWQLENLPRNALRIEYAIHFAKKNGTQTLKKFHVFDGINPDTKKTFYKHHSFVQRTTRKHHKGEHWLELFVNGCAVGKQAFMLL